MLETHNLDALILMSYTFRFKTKINACFSQLCEGLKNSAEICVLEQGSQVGLSRLK